MRKVPVYCMAMHVINVLFLQPWDVVTVNIFRIYTYVDKLKNRPTVKKVWPCPKWDEATQIVVII